MVNRQNKRKTELRSNITYKAAKSQGIVGAVVYEWLKNTKAGQVLKFKLLRDWQAGIVMLLIDFKNLKKKPKNPEYDHFLQKYMSKYLEVK